MKIEAKNKLIGFICALTATFFWGFHAIVIRYLEQQHVNTYLISTSRLFIGSFFLTAFILISRFIKREKLLQPDKFVYGKFFWLAACGLGLNFIFFHQGLNYTIASDAILLEAFSSVMVLVLMVIFFPNRNPVLKNRKNLLSRLFLLVIAGSIGSALLIINQPHDSVVTVNSKMIGDFLEFFAMIFFALFFIGSSEHKKINTKATSIETSARFLFVAGLIVSLTLPLGLTRDEIVNVTLTQWLLIFGIGIFSTGVTYTLWYHAAKYLDVVALTLLFNLSSIFTVLWEAIFFKLNISWYILIGAALILYSSFSAEMITSKKPEDEVDQEVAKA